MTTENNNLEPPVNDKQYRIVPDNGHSLLLMETEAGLRTFADYKNLGSCLENIIQQYEELRVAKGLGKDNFELQHLWDWIDGFHRIELFVFDRQLSRYKKNTRSEMKELFIAQMNRLNEESDDGQSSQNPSQNNNNNNINDLSNQKQNGVNSRVSNGFTEVHMESEDDDDDVIWD